MKSREVVGRRIVGVRHRWVKTYGWRFVKVDAIVLDNGDELVPSGYEIGGDVAATVYLVKPEKKRR